MLLSAASKSFAWLSKLFASSTFFCLVSSAPTMVLRTDSVMSVIPNMKRKSATPTTW